MTMNRQLLFLNKLSRRSLMIAFAWTLFCAANVAAQEKDTEKVTYEDHVKPIFVQRCSTCHNGQKREGDLDVTNYINLMEGGGSGTVIEPQDASGSYLYQLIIHEESPEMPPSGTKIPESEIKLIAKWIDLGALENKGSVAAKSKPKFEMAMSANPTARPEAVPMPLRMPLEPVIKTARPSVLTIATSPWAPIAAVSAPKQILLYNTQTLELAGVLPMPEGVAHSLRFSRNGQLLLAGGGLDGASGKTVLFNVITGERITTIGDELESVLASDISPNHEFVAIGGPNKRVKILTTADGSIIAEINKHTEWVTALEFSPDGKYVATGDRNGGLHVWESDSGNEVFTLKAHTASISEISWRPDSAIVCSASEDGSVRLWEMKNGGQVKSWSAHGGGVTSMEFLRDGHIVSCGRDKLVKIWDQAGKMVKQFTGLTDVAVAVSFCDESKRVLAADWTGKLNVWNESDAKIVGQLATNPPTLAERLAASQQTLAAANQKHAPLAQQVTQTQTSLDELGKSLEQAKQTQVQIQSKMTAVNSEFAAAKQQFESTNAQHIVWRKEMEQKSTAKPLVQESLEKATAASQALPEDAELKSAITVFDSKLKQLDARMAELNGLVAKSDQEKNTSKAQMEALGKTLETTKSEMQAVTAQVNQMQGDMDVMNEKLKTVSEAAAAAQAEVQSATQMVQRWTSDISFISQMKALKDQLSSTELTIEEKQAAVDAAHKRLLEAQSAVDQAAKQKSDVQSKADDIKQQIKKLRGA